MRKKPLYSPCIVYRLSAFYARLHTSKYTFPVLVTMPPTYPYLFLTSDTKYLPLALLPGAPYSPSEHMTRTEPAVGNFQINEVESFTGGICLFPSQFP